jgi:cytochrome c peroxidase
MIVRRCKIVVLLITLCIGIAAAFAPSGAAKDGDDDDLLNQNLKMLLQQQGFTGKVGASLERRLGRPLDRKLADLGRNLFHDTILGLHNDNSCSGCHAATAGFGDTQSIAIGIDNNFVVGPDRKGPRNQRRTPMVINAAFFPALMWNSRFNSVSGDPFDNHAGFMFPLPEGFSLSNQPHLLTAQAFIPPTERTEAAGFDFPGDNFAIRDEVMRRLNGVQAYRKLFGEIFPEVKNGGPITYDMLARAISEFEFTLVFADAPLDRFARGDRSAMNDNQKKGALLFFGKANCVACHAVAGQSNEMFSDFQQHVLGVPQIAPARSNVVFDGPGANEDFGLEQVTGNDADRYRFRTSPLRNVALQPTFFHNGAFTRLEDAVRHHLNVVKSARSYIPAAAGVAPDLRGPLGPLQPVLERLDPLAATPTHLSEEEFSQLVEFLGRGLLDERAKPEELRKLIPSKVPSGRPIQKFQ